MQEVTDMTHHDGWMKDVSHLLSDLEEVVRNGAESLGSHASPGIASLRERLERIRETAGSGARRTNSYVHEHPWLAVGVVAAVAYLLGLAAGGRKANSASDEP
jgi:ElaB/YqjD/DUF883 family membrane-anchored ribosome-binding protein